MDSRYDNGNQFWLSTKFGVCTCIQTHKLDGINSISGWYDNFERTTDRSTWQPPFNYCVWRFVYQSNEKNIFQFKSTDFTFFVGAQCDLSGWCIDKRNKQLFIGVHGGEMWMTLQTACTRVWLKRFASFFASEAVSIWLTLLFVKRF